MSASVVSGVDASPVLEAGEHVLDPVPLAIEKWIVGMLDAMAGAGRDAGGNAAVGQCHAESCGTVGPISQQKSIQETANRRDPK